jgi:hypothetical protein
MEPFTMQIIRRYKPESERQVTERNTDAIPACKLTVVKVVSIFINHLDIAKKCTGERLFG